MRSFLYEKRAFLAAYKGVALNVLARIGGEAADLPRTECAVTSVLFQPYISRME